MTGLLARGLPARRRALRLASQSFTAMNPLRQHARIASHAKDVFSRLPQVFSSLAAGARERASSHYGACSEQKILGLPEKQYVVSKLYLSLSWLV